MKYSTKRLTRIAVMAALLCAASPWSVPIGPIPISIATFIVYLSGIVLGAFDGTISVAVYLLIGAVGVPVFSGFQGGVQKLIGVTGGYLIGYLICAFVVGLITDKAKRKLLTVPAMILGTVLLYAFGTLWFMFQTQRTLAESLMLCVVPFLLGDAAKIAVASAVGIPLRMSTEKWLSRSKSNAD